MAVTNYYTVNGQIIGEKTAGGSRVDYLTDALGSVIGTVNQSAQVVNTYRYKPYGAQLAKTGVGADPAFQWVGDLGYRPTAKKWSDVYVRRRHFDTAAAMWTSRDILRPMEHDFVYASGNPVVAVDPSGAYHERCCHQILGFWTSTSPVNSSERIGHDFTIKIKVKYRLLKPGEDPFDCSL